MNAVLKIPPHSVDAEMSVIGATLINPESRFLIDLQTDDFYRSEHRKIFDAVMSCETPDIVTVAEVLESRGELDEIGGLKYLDELRYATPNADNIEAYAKTVSDRSAIRRGITLCNQVVDAGFSSDLKTMTEKLASSLDVLAQGRDEVWDVKDSVAQVIQQADAIQRGDQSMGVPYGIPKLDDLYPGGMKPGNLIVLAARPSMGKTILMQNIAVRSGRPAGIISLEMQHDELAQRGMAMLSGVACNQIENGQLSQTEWDAVANAGAEYSGMPIHVVDRGVSTAADISRVAHGLKQRHNIELLAVDYLQLLKTEGGGRYQTVTEASIELKQLAKKLGIPIILLSQLSRNCESREDKRPILADLRESGQIEQDADVVMFLYRDSVYNNQSPKDQVEIIIRKYRNGPANKVTEAKFDGARMTIA